MIKNIKTNKTMSRISITLVFQEREGVMSPCIWRWANPRMQVLIISKTMKLAVPLIKIPVMKIIRIYEIRSGCKSGPQVYDP
jgi:hypothetical protein